ncbi:MAG: hypothetical protein ACLPSO_03275, partial [Terracidiphilus sp.]
MSFTVGCVTTSLILIHPFMDRLKHDYGSSAWHPYIPIFMNHNCGKSKKNRIRPEIHAECGAN